MVSADDNTSVVDQINITVPVSCTMTGTGMDSHSTEIENGLYKDNIGTTTLHAFCNDNEGFAIYAAGYTGNEIGGTNSNKLVGTNASSNATIVSGIATTAGSPDISNWAMKLAISQDSGDTTSTNAFTIDSAPNVDLPSEAEQGATSASFSDYHMVPNEYVKVAHKNSMTDMTVVSGGVKLTTTYAAYISKTQPADTYTGQVIYTLIHPSNGNPPVAPDQIGVNYHGNGLTFAGGMENNRVVYGTLYTPMFIATTPQIVKSGNVSDDGVKNSAYASDVNVAIPITAEGASKMKVVVNYGVSSGTGLVVLSGSWDGQGVPHVQKYEMVSDGNQNAFGTKTYIFDGDSITMYMANLTGTTPVTDYDYGFWTQVYPIYAIEQSDTEEISVPSSFAAVTGTYAETTTWKGKWYIDKDDGIIDLVDESAVISYLTNDASLLGTTIDVYAYNPYGVTYNGNGATSGNMDDYDIKLEAYELENSVTLLAPNFKKAGYGFAGWSEDQNAVVNGNYTIYGPNEDIIGSELNFDSNNNTTLYAVWVVPEDGITMQTFDGTIEPYVSYGIGSVIALRDIRDDNVYAIAKFDDGNWWMIENLRLNIATAVDEGGNTTINSSTTNSPTSSFIDKIGAVLDGTDAVYWKTCRTDSAGCDDQLSFGTDNIDFEKTASPSEDSQEYSWYSYGVMYNYYTATAGNGTYVASAYDAGDICPINWRIPRGHDSLMADHLGLQNNTIEAGQKIREYPYNFIYAGRYYGSYASGRNRSVSYMGTGNAVAFRNAPVLSLNRTDGARWVAIETAKWNGWPVRCYAIGQSE